MKYEPRFSLGDVVFHIANHSRPKWVDCPMCRGDKRVTVNGETDTCPKCCGRGGEQSWHPEGWHVARSGWEDRDNFRYHEMGHSTLTIGQVRMVHTKGKRPLWEAMCLEYGVGSGTVFDMDKMFATVDEAQAKCDELNAKEMSK